MFSQLGVYDSLNAPVVLLVACIVYNMDERLPVRQTEILFGYLMMRMKEVLDRKFGKKLRQVVDLEGEAVSSRRAVMEDTEKRQEAVPSA